MNSYHKYQGDLEYVFQKHVKQYNGKNLSIEDWKDKFYPGAKLDVRIFLDVHKKIPYFVKSETEAVSIDFTVTTAVFLLKSCQTIYF